MGRVLVVGSDPVARDQLLEVLRDAGHFVRGARGASEARAAAQEFRPEVAVADVKPVVGEGLSLLVALRELDPAPQVIVVTAFGWLPVALEAVRRGAFEYVSRPFRPDEIRQTVARALAAAAPMHVREPAPPIFGRSPPMIEVLKAVARVAPLRVPVLLRGETGSGKERIARAIHDASDRRGRPYLTVNCAALREPMLDTRLFGGAKDVATGAAVDRGGLFAAADGGTILLDEIGDMPLAVQAKLLHVLEAGEVQPDRVAQTRTIDVRMIAATHRELPKAVEDGTFRRDLLPHLSATTITLPPLREHMGDLPLLVEELLDRHARTAGREVPAVAPDAMLMLGRYSWPGNVRELSHVLARAVALARGPRIEVEDLPAQLSDAGAPLPHALATPLPRTLDAVEKAHILAVLKSVGGNRVRAASILDIDRKTLYRKLIRWGMQRPEDEEALRADGA